MQTHALFAALLAHALALAAPPTISPVPFIPPDDVFDYDYSADVEAQEAILVKATTTEPPDHMPRDPLADARAMARLNIMDRILIALGPPFGEKLPEAPVSDTLATVPTPINITTEPCPYKYKRCSSQTYFPSCGIPRNTAPEIWPQRFNLFFNLSADFDSKLDVINATLRLYKNNSLPLQRPKTLLIKAFVYIRSLTRRRNRTKLVADTQIPSDYLGWVTLSVTEIVRRWKKQKNNHGVLITVNDVDDTPWDAPRIFVTMDCASGMVPLPFEVQTEQEGQQYPALNVRLGSPDDEPEQALSSTSLPPPSASPSVLLLPPSTLPPPGPTMQGDDPELYDYNYEADLEDEEGKERVAEGLEPQAEEHSQLGDMHENLANMEPLEAFHSFYNFHTRAHHALAPLPITPTPQYPHQPPTPPTPPTTVPITTAAHTTPIPTVQVPVTELPAPTRPIGSIRGPVGKRGRPRHHRRHRAGGHRRG